MAETGVVFAADLIAAALAANDRLKFYLATLQAAQSHAQGNDEPDLRQARHACGVSDELFDLAIAGSSRAADGATLVPGAARIRAAIFDDLQQMVAPIAALSDVQAGLRATCEAYRRRQAALAAALPSWEDGRVTADALALTVAPPGGARDSIHALVIDLHREVNALLPLVSRETVDGARVSGIVDDDRGLVAAFMTGLNTTAPLKFDHPGLETIATRYDGCLALQNELGTTAGHRLVIRIRDLDVTITYADARRARIAFFALLLEPSGARWESAPAEPGAIVMTTGRLTAADRASLERFLTFLGSRLVFLIDWNRARKELSRVLRKRDAIAILKWAADNGIGHRGFLQSGGMRLVSTAAERVAPAALRYGARLDELLGHDAAISFLQSVLGLATAGLRQGHSGRLIQDEVEAELLSHLRSAEARAIDAAADHACLLSSLAERVLEILDTPPAARPDEAASRLARLATDWEARADDIVRDAGRLPAIARHPRLTALLESADEAADALEETAFLLTLLHDLPGESDTTALSELARVVCDEVRAYIQALEQARLVSRRRTRAAVEDILLTADRIAALEHAADAAERAARAAFVRGSGDFRELQTLSNTADCLEHAADAVAHCARLLRDHALASGDPA